MEAQGSVNLDNVTIIADSDSTCGCLHVNAEGKQLILDADLGDSSEQWYYTGVIVELNDDLREWYGEEYLTPEQAREQGYLR